MATLGLRLEWPTSAFRLKTVLAFCFSIWCFLGYFKGEWVCEFNSQIWIGLLPPPVLDWSCSLYFYRPSLLKHIIFDLSIFTSSFHLLQNRFSMSRLCWGPSAVVERMTRSSEYNKQPILASRSSGGVLSSTWNRGTTSFRNILNGIGFRLSPCLMPLLIGIPPVKQFPLNLANEVQFCACACASLAWRQKMATKNGFPASSFLWLLSVTVADTCLVLFFSGISNALRLQSGANIYNVFGIFATHLKHLKVVKILATRLKHLKHVLNEFLLLQLFCLCNEF